MKFAHYLDEEGQLITSLWNLDQHPWMAEGMQKCCEFEADLDAEGRIPPAPCGKDLRT